MLWASKRQPEPPVLAGAGAPVALPVALDARLFEIHFKALLVAAEAHEGVEAWLDALGEKQRRIVVALVEGRHASLVDLVFGARRKLGPLVEAPWLAQGLAALSDEREDVRARVAGFVAAVPAGEAADREARREQARLKRSAHDLATEVVHFRDPVRVPLMTRWVWDPATMTGSLRELVHGADAMATLPFDASPATFEAARRWIGEHVAGKGIFRDVHFWADLVLAAAYGHYFRAMTGGVLGADFQRAADPAEQITGLLGIDRILRERQHAHP